MTAPPSALVELVKGRPVEVVPGLVASALEHRLGAQLLSVAEAGEVELSADDRRALVAADIATSTRHRELWRGLSSAIDALEEVGIASIALKGVAAEARWYDRLGERPCSDVDLLIAPDDVDRVDRVLDRLWPDHPAADEVVTLVRRRQLQHVHLVWEGVPLDVHFDPLKLGIWVRQVDSIAETATTVDSPDGRPVPVLAPELALVGFLTHLNKDRFAYLGPYCDVARVTARSDLDWALVRRFVEGEGLEVPVWKSLAAVATMLELEIDIPSTGGWRARLWDRLWPPSARLLGHEGRSSSRHRQVAIPVLTTGRGREVAREMRRQLLPPRALLDVHRPDLGHHGVVRRLTLDRLRPADD